MSTEEINASPEEAMKLAKQKLNAVVRLRKEADALREKGEALGLEAEQCRKEAEVAKDIKDAAKASRVITEKQTQIELLHGRRNEFVDQAKAIEKGDVQELLTSIGRLIREAAGKLYVMVRDLGEGLADDPGFGRIHDRGNFVRTIRDALRFMPITRQLKLLSAHKTNESISFEAAQEQLDRLRKLYLEAPTSIGFTYPEPDKKAK